MIDREKVIKGLEHCSEDGCKDCPYESDCRMYDGFSILAKDALELLKEQESEAKWIYTEDETGVDGWHCSECDFFEPWFYEFTDDIDFIRYYKYCPGCGRKMTSYTGKPTKAGGGCGMRKEYVVELSEEEADELMGEHWVGELVRCGVCKYGHLVGSGFCICRKHETEHYYDWYCADGERR